MKLVMVHLVRALKHTAAWASLLLLLGLPSFRAPLYAQQPTAARLLRFPTVSANSIVFTYAGDLYTVARSGGLARKLTNHAGFEAFAHFSPDGQTIAFSAQYDGNTEVYVMPATGGVPKRLTFTATVGRDDYSDRMGPNNIVMGWTPDGKNIIYRSRNVSFNDFKGLLYSISSAGGMPVQMPFSVGSWNSYSPEGNQLAMNRIFREFRTWKYYEGGMADDVYIYDFRTERSTNITNNKAQDAFPMWVDNTIYFWSDRDRIANIFAYDIGTRQTRKVTQFSDYDVKFPTKGKDAIIFEQAGYLHLIDTKNGQTQQLNIQIADDFSNGRNAWVDASKYINGVDLSPDGRRLLINGRGEIFSVPAQQGVVRNFTQSAGTHDREAVWSPDGQSVAYLSDASGEYQIYIQTHDGSGQATQLTTSNDNYIYNLTWSPDNKKLLFHDKALRLRYIDVRTKAITEVDKAESWEFGSYNWSPDSRWIAYTRPEWQTKSQIYLYNLETKEKFPVTDNWYESGSPVFSPDGKYLYFTSARDFNPIYSNSEWNHAYTDMNKVYIALLSKNTPSPFRPKNTEVDINDTVSKKGADKKASANLPKSEPIAVDKAGIQDRIIALPIAASNYYNLIPRDDQKIYYIMRSSGVNKSMLKIYDLEAQTESTIGAVFFVQLSANRKKLLVNAENQYYVIDPPADGPLTLKDKDKVQLNNLQIWVEKQAEWKQIYNECWRQMRDFFYDPNTHGSDWKAVQAKYAALLPYVQYRDDLNYIIGEMIGELNCGHAYINGGDRPTVDRVPMGLLGCQYARANGNAYYQVKKIIYGQNWSPSLRSPLTESGVDVKEGEFIIAINGTPTNTLADISIALMNTADQVVELLVNGSASPAGARKVYVRPIKDESTLYYYQWVQDNIRRVSEATNGEVGYLHIPDMGPEGLNEFVKHFYPQLNKKALIVDVRGNGGGNVSPMILERLRRELDMVLMSRNTKPTTSPAQIMLGPKVALCDQYSASDGDLFSYRFKKYKIGTLIGVRSWGGTVGIRGSLPFVDGADLRKPEFSRYDVDGREWIIEGYGVDPDIVVENLPEREFKGNDDQLDKAIEIIKSQLKNFGKELAPMPPFPNKSGR
jgi:tricorn protease